MRLHIPSFLLAAFCVGCSGRAVVKGALTGDERREYVEQTGALIPQRLKEDFVAGRAAEGMSKEMVVFLYGQPDRTENNRYGISWNGETDSSSVVDTKDSLWNYLGPDSVSVKRGMVFRGDTLVRVVGDLAK
ncbi:MAG TPA: hypothetical protein VJ385_14515 [Fibrobacteria bacterium]|nr:hypothetical protein [Fibrobacteria bacterium]